MTQRSVGIIGGGFAGLWLAAELTKRQFKVEVFERADHPGGLLRSRTWKGMAIDIGPHIYFEDYRHWYEAYLDEPLERVDAYYAFGFRKRQIRSPITPRNMFKDLPFWSFVALTLSFVAGRMAGKAGKEPTTAKDWALSKYGRIAYNYFFRDYIPKLTGLEADEVSHEWGSERERFYQQHNLVQKTFKLITQFFSSSQQVAAPLKLYYAPRGAERIIAGLRQFIEAHGGVIHTGHTLEKIDRGTDGKAVLYFRHGDEEKVVTPDFAVSTLPLPNLVRLTQGVSPDVVDAARQLRFRHVWCLYFVLRRPRLMDKMQIYFVEKKYLFKRVYETPPQGHGMEGYTCICAEVCFSPGDHIGSMAETELLAIVREQLMDYYDLDEDDFEDAFSLKAPNAYAVYSADYRRDLDVVADYLYGFDTLISYGRAGLFRYNALTDRIIDSGQTVLQFMESGQSKADFLGKLQPKGDFL